MIHTCTHWLLYLQIKPPETAVAQKYGQSNSGLWPCNHTFNGTVCDRQKQAERTV